MKMNRLVPLLVVAIAIYLTSFCIVRVVYSADYCSLRLVDFPVGVLRIVYRPLIVLDKKLNADVVYSKEVDEVRFAQKLHCGE